MIRSSKSTAYVHVSASAAIGAETRIGVIRR
jgi:hypothetical protein